MGTEQLSSWGHVIRAEHPVFRLAGRRAAFPDITPALSILPRGNGRSYGDSCLNVGGALLDMRALDRFIDFDPDQGLLTCEAGILLDEILQLAVPRGWFIPVTPGTRYITVGGAVANDVHGKNHHRAGTFSSHVLGFELLRSDGQRRICSGTDNADWFAATVGGLGLTGVITWVQLRLRRIAGPLMDVETIRFANLDEFLGLSAESDSGYEYTVAWIDCLSRGRQLGRGLMQRANHATVPEVFPRRRARQRSVPLTPPFSLVNAASLRLFNTAYYHRQQAKVRRSLDHYESFFYPLDGVRHWNRLYGPHGMFQYQCVIPAAAGTQPVAELLNAIARNGQGSFLAVLKAFGTPASVGMLSFPRPGLTLALDFPNRGERLEALFRELDVVVETANGRIYPAKDGRMPATLFRSGYPRWSEFNRYVDPYISSSFWRRVTGNLGNS
jgi:FAD/FMN-containing dehydrogenase